MSDCRKESHRFFEDARRPGSRHPKNGSAVCYDCDKTRAEVAAEIVAKDREVDTLSLLAHAVTCQGCRIRVRTVEAGDLPDLRGKREQSTLYVDKPESWILCAEGRERLERTRA